MKEKKVAVYDFSSLLGTNIRAQNITYTSAGSSTIQINITSILSVKNFSAFISASELDKNNEFSVEETFNVSPNFPSAKGGANDPFIENETLSYQTDSGLWVFDDFVRNSTAERGWATTGNEPLQYIRDSVPNRNLTLFFTVSTGNTGDLTYTDSAADLRNTSQFELLWYGASSSGSGSSSGMQLF